MDDSWAKGECVSHTRCVLLCPRGNGEDVQEPGTIPTELFRVLRRKNIDVQVSVDAHESLAFLVDFERQATRPTAMHILLIVHPDRVLAAEDLVAVVRDRLPATVIWCYDEGSQPPLHAWPTATTPKLRLAGADEPDDEAAQDAPDDRAPDRPERPKPAERQDDETVGPEELHLLMASGAPPGRLG